MWKIKVLKIISEIKKGSVQSYKDVATKAGNPRASRSVGNICANNKDKNIPCHRVIRSDGSLGSYNGLRGRSKKKILADEGYRFDYGKQR